MKCTGYFKELREGKKAYATVAGSIEPFDCDHDGIGFYPDETESWVTLLCERCSIEVHNFIAEHLQAKHL